MFRIGGHRVAVGTFELPRRNDEGIDRYDAIYYGCISVGAAVTMYIFIMHFEVYEVLNTISS